MTIINRGRLRRLAESFKMLVIGRTNSTAVLIGDNIIVDFVRSDNGNKIRITAPPSVKVTRIHCADRNGVADPKMYLAKLAAQKQSSRD